MKINEIIKENRLKLNLTQEQIANSLGVSTPAVNKWENGVSYPDITLLPPLARLLKVDLNTLLSFNEDLADVELWEFINDTFGNINSENFDTAYNLSVEKIREFPNCDKLIFNVAQQLNGNLYIYKIENKQKYEDKINEWYNICIRSEDLEIKNQTISMLIGKAIIDKNYELAQNYVDMLPNVTYDKTQNQGAVYRASGEIEKAIELYELKLMKTSIDLYTVLITLMEIAMTENNIEHAKYIGEIIEKSTNLFEMWKFHAISPSYLLAIHLKDQDQTIVTIERMFEFLKTTYNLNDTKLYSHVKTKIQSEDNSQFFNYFFELIKNNLDGNLDFVKNNSKFIEIIEKYSK